MGVGVWGGGGSCPHSSSLLAFFSHLSIAQHVFQPIYASIFINSAGISFVASNIFCHLFLVLSFLYTTLSLAPHSSMHNDVNRRLGKPIFDCAMADKRWLEVCMCMCVCVCVCEEGGKGEDEAGKGKE